MSTPEFPAEQPTEAPHNLADWGTRALGYLIDFAPILVLSLIFRSGGLGVLVNLGSLAYFVYMGFLDGTSGQTPGKAIMGTRVVNQAGEVVGAGAGIGRKFLHILDSLV